MQTLTGLTSPCRSVNGDGKSINVHLSDIVPISALIRAIYINFWVYFARISVIRRASSYLNFLSSSSIPR